MRSAILRAATNRSSLFSPPTRAQQPFPCRRAAGARAVHALDVLGRGGAHPRSSAPNRSSRAAFSPYPRGPGDYVAFEEMVAEIETGAFAAPRKNRLTSLIIKSPQNLPRARSRSPFVPLADKVTIEAKSPHAGTIKKVYVEIGQTVEVGNPFFSIAVGEGEATVAVPAAAAAAPAAEPAAAAAAPAVAAAAPAAAGRIHPSGKPSLVPSRYAAPPPPPRPKS